MYALPPDEGLTLDQVERARKNNGWNELPEAESDGPFTVFARQVSSFLVAILIIAAGIALALGEVVDAAPIGLVVVLNAVLGFVQEWRAETALLALRNMLSPKAMVVREGQEQMVPARDLVPGDLLVIGPGTRVAEDAQLQSALDIRIDESILTGESTPGEKSLLTNENRIFTGTFVLAGRAEAGVSAIGSQTKFGQIARLTGSVGPKKTDLQIKLARLAQQLGGAALLPAVAISALGILMGRAPTEMIMMGFPLSVAMVPERLPAVVTITLALGAHAMVRQKALARRLQAVETLGAASVICTDKTGTLTENKMTATNIWTMDRVYTVTGTGYDPAGHIELDGVRLRAADEPVLNKLLRAGLYCNHAHIDHDGAGWHMTGGPTEGALVALAYKGWCPIPRREAVLAEIPFSSERKSMSVLNAGDAGTVIYTKGASEHIDEVHSSYLTSTGVQPIEDAKCAAIQSAYTDMASQGLRVIAVALREVDTPEMEENHLTFAGLIGDRPSAQRGKRRHQRRSRLAYKSS